MSINPRIAPDVFAHDAAAHAGLVIGRDYMERERTSVVTPTRAVRIATLTDINVREAAVVPLPAEACSHDVREFAGKFPDGSYVVWGFAYCDHTHQAFTTFPRTGGS